jgi:membrane-bound inhibitor of C-type lysozyme
MEASMMTRTRSSLRQHVKLILACLASAGTVNSASAAEASYRCADGTAVHALFSAPGPTGSVRLTFAGKGGSVSLPQAPSADGGRYADGGMEFWIKGKTARLTRAAAVTECKTR